MPPLPPSRPAWKPSTSAEGDAPPTNNLWIGNLAPEVSDADLMSLFSKHGEIDSITNYSARTYAFVHFKDVEDAKTAKENIQGTVLHGNPLKIEFAKPAKPCKSLWVAGISQSVSKEELEEEFKKFGEIQVFKFLRDRGTAYVDYFRLEDASQALESMNGKRIGGDSIRVDFLRSQSSRRDHGPDFRDTKDGHFLGRSMGPQDARWVREDSFQAYSEPIFVDHKRHFLPPEGRKGEGQPSKVLWIRYPPSVRIEEDMLYNAMILFGEIEGIKRFDERNYAFVQFRSIDEARLAKEGLQGKLFSDPRISIEYSNTELAPPDEYFGTYSELKGPRTDIQSSEVPLGPGQMDYFGHRHHVLHPRGIIGPEAILRPGGPPSGFEQGFTNSEFDDLVAVNKLRDADRHIPLGGPNWSRSSPAAGMLSSPSAGFKLQNRSVSGLLDTYDAGHLQRETKRPRVDATLLPPYDASFPPDRIDGRLGLDDPLVNFDGRNHLSPMNSRTLVRGHGQRNPGNDYVWRGLIARNGTPICHARCVPIGEGIESDIPDVVNCAARTGLDMLTKHYADAVGFSIVFFLPDSEADFAPYTEFLRYLGSKNRAGVAKFEDGTTLFLVPPSDFLTRVLNVVGPDRLYGVVLQFPQAATGASAQPTYAGIQPQNASQTRYRMPHDESALQMSYNHAIHDGVKAPLKTTGLPNPILPTNNVAAPQPGVALTPELIATLATLLPASNKLSGTENLLPQSTSSTLDPAINVTAPQAQRIAQSWQDELQVRERSAHPVPQFSSQFHTQPQFPSLDLAYQPVSSTPSLTAQLTSGYSQVNDHNFDSLPQGIVSSRAATSAIPLQGQVTVSSHLDLQSHGITQGTDSSRFYGPSVNQQPIHTGVFTTEANGGMVQHLQSNVPLASGTDLTNQVQQLSSATLGVGPEVSETEDEKNRRYQSTLLFAANLLSKVQQPPGNQTGQT